MTENQQFASDNYAGICPEAWEAMQEANHGHVAAYGEDTWTHRACARFREIFETDCEVFFVGTGTASNALSLATLCKPYQSIISHRSSHIENDECGAPEFFTNGAKLLLVEGRNGKMDPAAVEAQVNFRNDLHYPKPAVVSITQATELGTTYSAGELGALADVINRHNLRWHVDGARFANAVAHLGVSPKSITWELGVDVLCFGGTKNGQAYGDAVLFFDRALAEEFTYRCKQGGQLLSKMRFVAAQWLGLLADNVWLRNARHANKQAERLRRRLASEAGLEPMFPREANSVFVKMPERVAEILRAKGWVFYTFIGEGGARLMCSWDTTDETIERFAADVKEAVCVGR